MKLAWLKTVDGSRIVPGTALSSWHGLEEGVLLMIEILHDLKYNNPRNSGNTVHMGSCRIYIINSISLDVPMYFL